LLGRPVKRALLRTIELAASEGEFLRSLVPAMEKEAELDVRELRNLPLAIQRRTIHSWLQHHHLKDCGFEEIEAVRSLLNDLTIAKINLPGSVFCRRRSGRLFVQFPGS
jgi:hypothetical protein